MGERIPNIEATESLHRLDTIYLGTEFHAPRRIANALQSTPPMSGNSPRAFAAGIRPAVARPERVGSLAAPMKALKAFRGLIFMPTLLT